VKKKIIISLMVVAILMLSVTMAFAGGDQVRGDNAAGDANQNQVMDPPPFQPRPNAIVLYKTSWDGNVILLYSK